MSTAANLVEVFSSVQGEGLHVGATTLFVRFGECDLRCRWCDSPQTWRPARRCRVETPRGSGRFEERENPVPLDDVVALARALGVERHRFVSLTGGEPLLQPDAVRGLAERLRPLGPRIHLETHGLALEALERVVDAVDVVAMDWKLASDVRRAHAPRGSEPEAFHATHTGFLRIAARAPERVVKVVVTNDTRDEELDAMARAIASVDPATPLVVQPVTPFAAVREPVPAARLLDHVFRLSRSLLDVRLIPQTHKAYGAL
ncbi:MAG: 7-carboxy-7-deazaguanine synthase QueE [Myxococcota bacterium]